MNGDISTSRAKAYLQQLEQLLDELIYARDQFDNRLRHYEPANPRARIDLQSSIAHFEKYILPFMVARQNQDTQPIENAETLTLGIDGYWGAYEFHQMFDGVDYLSKLSTIRAKLEDRSPDFRLPRGMTRSPVYRKANLSYYLSTREELRVQRIQFSSPGLVSFEGVGDVIKEIRENFDYVITGEWVKRLLRNYYDIRQDRDIRRVESSVRLAELNAQKAEALLREIEAKSKLKAAIRRTRLDVENGRLPSTEQMHRGLVIVSRDSDLIIRLDADRLADISKVEDSYMHSISQLHRLSYEQGKVTTSLPPQIQE